MEYRKLGKWGMKVSAIGLGSWLTSGTTVDQKANDTIFKTAFDNGINFFDTANVYATGVGEIVVGKSIKQFGRSDIVLATKVFFPMSSKPNDSGLSRKHIFEQCDASLKRMDVDYIDLYQCHRYDPLTDLYETVLAMNDLIRNGKILYWGVSEWTAEQIRKACQIAYEIGGMPPVSNQPCYNLLHRTIEKEVVPACLELGLGQVVFSPLAQGVLTGKYKPKQEFPEGSRASNPNVNMFLVNRNTMAEPVLEAVQEVNNLAIKNKMTLSSLALAWCLKNSNVSSAIIGASNDKQILENVAACSLKLVNELLEQAEQILAPYSNF